MAIPTYQEVMRPLLEYLAEANGEVRFSDLCEGLVNYFPGMTREELEGDRLPSSGQPRFVNRVGWAVLELKHAALTHSPRYAYHEITPRGREAIADENTEINRRYLMQYSEFREYVEGIDRNKRSQKPEQPKQEIIEDEKNLDEETSVQDDWKTPDEQIDSAISAIEKINNDLEERLLDRAREIEPGRFEQIVVELLIAMGYGSFGERLGQRGDGGVDGVINQDALGVDRIYIQAKRFNEANVTPSHVRDFNGALDMKGVHKGIFVTTSSFSSDAKESVQQMQKNIILIDGKQLAKLMVCYNIGCTEKKLVVKEMKEEFFE